MDVNPRVSSQRKSTTYQVTLSPPWQTQYQKLRHTVGADPLVQVGPLVSSSSGATYTTKVKVIGNLKARALATLIRQTVPFGNVTFKVVVVNQNGVTVKPFQGPFSALRVRAILTRALRTNRLFRFAAIRSTSIVYPVFAKRVVQFYNDNLADYYLNFNGVAAFVFAEVLKGSLGNIAIDYSTFSTSAPVGTKRA